MTNEERAIALVYHDVICRMTEEVEAQRIIKEALDAACDEATNARDHEIAALTREVERWRAVDSAKTEKERTTLEGLVGWEVGFCGVDNHTIALMFRGKLRAFEVVEDEADGYRSSLDEVREVPLGDTIHFSQPVVRVTVGRAEALGDFTGYMLTDSNGHVWLRAGTDYGAEYYPCFVFDYTPPLATVAEVEAPRWVPVEERLPTYDEIVLACTSDGEIFMGEWREHDTDPGGAWWSDDDEIVRVTAWQPLPAPWVAP